MPTTCRRRRYLRGDFILPQLLKSLSVSAENGANGKKVNSMRENGDSHRGGIPPPTKKVSFISP